MTSEDKGHILREVYEDNRRIRERSWMGNESVSRHPWLAVLALLAIISVALWFVGDPGSEGERATGLISPGNATIAVPIDSSLQSAEITPTDLSGIVESNVPLSTLFDLSVRRVVIDPGHGGVDPGASGRRGLAEKEITLDVARRLARRLRNGHGLQVYQTRTQDTSMSLRERAEYTNTKNADLFISIHVNYFPTEPVYALETYYFGSQSSQEALDRAQFENQNSDYSVAEFNKMINRIEDRLILQESQRLARAVQSSLIRNTRRLNSEVSDWGVKSAPFVVLIGVDAAGILAEIGVISNEDEEARLATPEYREQLALFLEEGVVNYLSTLTGTANN